MDDQRRRNDAAEEREDEHAPAWLEHKEAGRLAGGEGRGEQAGGGDAHAAGHARGHGHSHSHAHHDDHDHDHDDHHDHDEHRGHSHGHGHHHHHHTPAVGHGRAFALAVALNLVIVVTQTVYGVIAHSTALLADAGHNLSDVLGLLLAWGAAWLATRRPSGRYTFGFGNSSILASLANAALLLIACGAIIAQALGRLVSPAPVAGLDVFIVATIGMVVNGFSAWLFMRGQKDDINIRGAFLHMASDAGVSAAVAISGLVILATGWSWVDPIMSIVVVLVIVYGTWGLLRESVRLALAAVPQGVDMERIRVFLAAQDGVTDVHDLHIWPLSTTGNALSAHLVMPAGHPGDDALDGIVHALSTHYSMKHVTLQVDLGTTAHRCALDVPAHRH
jgi:cobalt-zinc-cadmium efflux system protein